MLFLLEEHGIPFPVLFEILIMEVSFELLREASLRIPSPMGSTVGIIGGLILGEAAVSANLVSPLLIIIVAITGICSFAIPDFALGFALRVFRFAYLILSYISGFLGIGLRNICTINSFI
ncbi:MAG: spore germination protein [Clostridia bacterium]|nr:spore germination protein [Clostridia bacterium]